MSPTSASTNQHIFESYNMQKCPLVKIMLVQCYCKCYYCCLKDLSPANKPANISFIIFWHLNVDIYSRLRLESIITAAHSREVAVLSQKYLKETANFCLMLINLFIFNNFSSTSASITFNTFTSAIWKH